jgi:hypothetical protein
LPGVIFAPIGHELLILYGKKREFSEKLLYRSDENGVLLMMAIPGTAAEESGLKQNDLISRINGEPVTDSLEMLQKIEDSYFMVLLEGMRGAEPFSLVLKKKYENSEEKPDSFQTVLKKRLFTITCCTGEHHLVLFQCPHPIRLYILRLRRAIPGAGLSVLQADSAGFTKK